MREIAVAGLMLLAVATWGVAAPPPKVSELGVDQVLLKAGNRLAGSILHKSRDGTLTVAVRRDWLRGRSPAFFNQQLDHERTAARTALTTLLERIEQWQSGRPDDEKLNRFLTKEEQRIRKQVDEWARGEPVMPPRFLLIDVPAAKIDSTYLQPAARKQIALVAWAEDLPDVESQPVTKLSEELVRRGVNVAERKVDFSADVSPRPEDERAWAARQALVEFHLRKSVAFQGTAELLVRTGDGAAEPDVGQIVADLLKTQVEAQLNELLGAPLKPADLGKDNKALQKAQQTAAKEQVSGFRVSRLAFDLAKKTVSVEGRFLARMPDGTWETIWEHAETVDASKPRPEVEKELRENEQVRQVLKLASAAGADEQIAQAVRCGAATKAAQEAADARFYEFFDRYTARLDGPPLHWTSSK